jgi:hypothetical protein
MRSYRVWYGWIVVDTNWVHRQIKRPKYLTTPKTNYIFLL